VRKFFNTHNFYLVSLSVKALNGFFEIIGSIFILASDFSKWPKYINVIFRKELIEDPNDIVANLFIDALGKIDISIQLSSFLYLLSHGLVKLFLVIALLKKKYWAYPLSEVVLFLFIIYQTYLYINNGSIFILFLNAIDIILMALIWLEYKKIKTDKVRG
jgi:uncharacterized membrane protein